MYGVTEGGNSVMAHIHNFLSYFYVEVRPEKKEKVIDEKMLNELRDKLNN